MGRWSIAAFLGALLVVLGAYPLSATVITVTTTLDVIDPEDGLCSLREAVIVTNQDFVLGDPGTGECPAGEAAPVHDTIMLEGGPFVLTLPGGNEDDAQTGDLDIVAPLVVVGGTDDTVIDGSTLDRVLHIQSPGDDGVLAIFKNLLITGGNASTGGGGIFADSAQVSLINCTVEDNDAVVRGGGILALGVGFTGPQIELIDTVVQGNVVTGGAGGGIALSWSLVATDSTITDNEATQGGGIASVQPGLEVLLVDSAVSNNLGSGIFLSSMQLFLVGTTVSGNSHVGRGGGIRKGGSGNLVLVNSTISGNESTSAEGGGIFVTGQGALISVNSTFAENLAASGGSAIEIEVFSNYLANTLISGTCGGGGDFVPSVGNLESPGDTCVLPGSATVNVTPMDLALGPLADNGGPTLTHLPAFASVAVDAGDDAECTVTDQRGVGRPKAAGCEIGAVEVACNGAPIEVVENMVISTTETIVGCIELHLGPMLSLVSPADVVFAAGDSIVLNNGVSIEGDSVGFVITPDL